MARQFRPALVSRCPLPHELLAFLQGPARICCPHQNWMDIQAPERLPSHAWAKWLG